jgi:hypothetical protein
MYLSILKPNPDKPEIPKHKYQKYKEITIKALIALQSPGLQIQTHVLSCDSYSPPLFDSRFNRISFL